MELAELIQHYRGPLIGLIVSWGAPWVDASEIAQDSFSEAFLKRDFCRGDWTQRDVFGRWLRGVALNQYRNWSRSRKRRERIVKIDSPVAELAMAASEQEPTEEVQKLRHAIQRLSLPHRQVVLMHYLEETSVNEVAILLGVSAKTVEGRLYQARLRLKKMLEQQPPAVLIGKVLICL